MEASFFIIRPVLNHFNLLLIKVGFDTILTNNEIIVLEYRRC